MRPKVLIVLCGLLAFGASVFGTFQFDDFGLINDSVITAPSGWWESWRLEQTRPLSWMSFWANYALGSESPWGYRLVNLLLHLAVACLLYDFLKRWIGEKDARIAALLFAVHPAVAEPVNYIAARPIILAALFSLLAWRDWAERRVWRAALWFALGMLSKEECAALPFVFAWWDWNRKRRQQWAPLAACFAIALALGLRAVWAASVVQGSQAGSQAGFTPLEYLAQQPVAWADYLVGMTLPVAFTVDHGSAAPVWFVVFCLLLVSAAIYFARRSAEREWLVAAALLVLPSSSILPAADLIADRRVYLPLLAASAAGGIWLAGRKYVRVLAALIVISMIYTWVWQSPVRLWTWAVWLAPNCARCRVQLSRVTEPQKALQLLERVSATDVVAATERGRVLLGMGRAEEALAEFGRALALDPSNAATIANRGAALLALGQAEAARADFERALGRDPCQFDALLNLRRMGVGRSSGAGCRYSKSRLAMLQ